MIEKEFKEHCNKNYPKCMECKYLEYCHKWWKRMKEKDFDKLEEKKFVYIMKEMRKEKLNKLLGNK